MAVTVACVLVEPHIIYQWQLEATRMILRILCLTSLLDAIGKLRPLRAAAFYLLFVCYLRYLNTRHADVSSFWSGFRWRPAQAT